MSDGTNERTEQETGTEQEPSTEQLQEPSTEKEPGQEPTAPTSQEGDPDHHAVGIGVIGGEQVVLDADSDPDDDWVDREAAGPDAI